MDRILINEKEYTQITKNQNETRCITTKRGDLKIFRQYSIYASTNQFEILCNLKIYMYIL